MAAGSRVIETENAEWPASYKGHILERWNLQGAKLMTLEKEGTLQGAFRARDSLYSAAYLFCERWQNWPNFARPTIGERVAVCGGWRLTFAISANEARAGQGVARVSHPCRAGHRANTSSACVQVQSSLANFFWFQFCSSFKIDSMQQFAKLVHYSSLFALFRKLSQSNYRG